LTYAERLAAPGPVNEPTPAPEPKPVIAPTAAAKETDAPPKETPVKPEGRVSKQDAAVPKPQPDVPKSGFTEPSGKGWAVQVMATVTRGEAETVARRLNAKGYPTFITLAGGAAPARYRVRVGKFDNKRDAEAVFQRLEQEEHFKPWLSQ
jgi:cell division septation protein DedD